MKQWIKTFLWLLILINISYVWTGARKFGSHSIDVYANWLLKAKILYFNNGSFPRTYLDNPEFKSAHWQYPLLWPFTVYQLYRIWGFEEQFIFNLYPYFYITALGLCYIFLRKHGGSKNESLFYTYMYSMVGPLIAQGGRMHPGNADLIVCLLGWLILNYLDKKWLVAVFVAMASMLKIEGVFWSVMLVGSNWFVLALAPTIFWQIVVNRLALPSDFGLVWRLDLVNQIWGLFRGFVREVFQIKQWYFVWFLFLLIDKPRLMWKRLIIILIGISMVYLFADLDSYDYVTSSLDRILLQVSPIWFTMLASYGFRRRIWKIGRLE